MPTKPLIPFRSIPLLVYHKVGQPDPHDPFLISLTSSDFYSHMKYLRDHKITPITLDRVSHLETQSDKCYVVITFDDGYLDNYTAAFPVLQEFNFVANIFLLASFIGTTVLTGTKEQQYLSIAQIKEMQKYGISFQSHTCTHPNLTQVGPKSIRTELTLSRTILEEVLGQPVRHLAYPYGAYNELVMQIACEANYEAAYAAGYAPNIQFARERFDAPKLKVSFPFSFPLIASGWGSYLRVMKNRVTEVRQRAPRVASHCHFIY